MTDNVKAVVDAARDLIDRWDAENPGNGMPVLWLREALAAVESEHAVRPRETHVLTWEPNPYEPGWWLAQLSDGREMEAAPSNRESCKFWWWAGSGGCGHDADTLDDAKAAAERAAGVRS